MNKALFPNGPDEAAAAEEVRPSRPATPRALGTTWRRCGGGGTTAGGRRPVASANGPLAAGAGPAVAAAAFEHRGKKAHDCGFVVVQRPLLAANVDVLAAAFDSGLGEPAGLLAQLWQRLLLRRVLVDAVEVCSPTDEATLKAGSAFVLPETTDPYRERTIGR